MSTPAPPVSTSGSGAPITWLSTPRRFPPGRMRILGPIVLAIHDWSRPKPGEPRMFDQSFLEWFTWVHPVVVPAVYVPVAIWLFWRGLAHGLPLGVSIGWFAAGVLLWTLLEYLIHRFSFHFTPRGRVGVVLAYLIHGVHHAYPEDHRRWITPPSVSFPIAAILYMAVGLVMSRTLDPLASGVTIGYLLYDLMHYWLHRGRMTSRVGRYLRNHHMQHHYASPERRYGVSTPFWDHVFRTHR